jgi:hypothetical protein
VHGSRHPQQQQQQQQFDTYNSYNQQKSIYTTACRTKSSITNSLAHDAATRKVTQHISTACRVNNNSLAHKQQQAKRLSSSITVVM